MKEIKLHNHTCLLKRPENETTTETGIIFNKKEESGELLEVVKSDHIPSGNIVCIKKYSGQEVVIDDETYIICSESDILLEIEK